MTAALKAGDLDRRITIQAFVEAQDSYGAPVETWQDVATVWAQIMPTRGREFWDAQQVVGEETLTIRIRWRPGMSVQNRIAYEGQIYDIASVAEIGRRVGLELVCVNRRAA